MGKPIRHRDKWRIRYVDDQGVRQSEVHDDFKSAAFALRQYEVRVEEIRRGIRIAPVDKNFGELCDYWIENRASRKRDPKDDASIIRCHLRPSFGELLIREIGVERADRFTVARSHLDPKTIANLLTLLLSMLNCAHDLGWLERVPRIKKPRIRIFDCDFCYLRSDTEIRRFLISAESEGEMVHALYATALLTGARAGELAMLTWGDVDVVRRLITLQRGFNGPTKAGDVRYVPILNELLPILQKWRLRNAGSVVFPNQAGRAHTESARVFQEVLTRVLERGGFAKVQRKGKTRGYIHFHDLRHTFASLWVTKGGDLFKLQKILGHKTVQMTVRYAHLVPGAFEADFGRFSGLVQGGAVLPLVRRGDAPYGQSAAAND